jgi:hypothetical protein
MDVPFASIFVVLLLVYLGYSVWARLDGRYPIGAALALLVVTAIVDAAGQTDLANTLAEYVFFLLAGGVVLLLIEHLRGRSRAAGTEPALAAQRVPSQPPEEGKRSADEPFHGLEEQPVAVVDGAGHEDRRDEPERDR